MKQSYPCQKCLRLFDNKRHVGAEMKTGGMPVVADYSRSAHRPARGQTAASESIRSQSGALSAQIYLSESFWTDHSLPQELYRSPHLPTIAPLFELDASVASPFAIKCGYDEDVAVAVVQAKMINKRPVEKGPA
ncbi:hypothetical protein E1N66_09730 [Pantoea allii]|nr:hypothetical protein [Pantoea allii]THB84563.1 hypothetical protein E1N66_09730 [Pantoea allii]